MRGKRAKAIRKKIYGDYYSHQERKYARKKSGQIIDTGTRGRYQRLKKQYMKGDA